MIQNTSSNVKGIPDALKGRHVQIDDHIRAARQNHNTPPGVLTGGVRGAPPSGSPQNKQHFGGSFNPA